MKTIFTFFILAFFSSTIMAQSSINLRYNLEPNKTYKVKYYTKADTKMTMQGKDQLSEQINMLYFSIKSLNSANAFFMAQVRFDSIFNSNSMPKTENSSANPGNMKSSDAKEITDCFMNRLSKSTLVVKMDYSGHVIDIMNYQVIEKVLLADIDSIKGQAEMTLKPRLIMMAEKETLKGMIEAITVYAPNKEVKSADKWEVSYTSKNGGFGMLVNSSLTLSELQNDVALINADVTIEPAAGKPMEMNGAEITADLRGIGKSELKIDPVSGWIISSNSTMQMNGNLNIKAQGQEMQMPMQISSTGEMTAFE